MSWWWLGKEEEEEEVVMSGILLLCLLQIQPAERAGGVCFPAEELTAERCLQLPRVQFLLLLERTHRPRFPR